MLVELKKLKIMNEGYKRSISLAKIYVNLNNVISIVDYSGAHDFLLREGADKYLDRSFSLVKVSEGHTVSEIIALGTAAELHSSFNSSKKGILNG
jgi:hypothetical protein